MNKLISIILVFIIISSASLSTYAYDINKIDSLVDTVGKYIFETVKNPAVGSVGGEWAVFGLARSNIDIPDEYYNNYCYMLKKHVEDSNGVLHEKKYTEYSRVIIALTSVGMDPTDVSGYNLLMPLADYEKTIWQGINSAIWALIALDCGNYDIPYNPDAKINATRDMYVDFILENQLGDGGWSLSGDTYDADVTGMALQALSVYRGNQSVEIAIQKALNYLSSVQTENGGFYSYDTQNSESCAQVIVALCALGISVEDARFVKNGYSIFDNLCTFYDEPGGFEHTHGNGIDQMSTEQCFYALVALQRFADNKSSLYNMNDIVNKENNAKLVGLPGKNPNIKKHEKIYTDKTFNDVAESEYKYAIDELASRAVIAGKTSDVFDPYGKMTRAEFATIIIKALGVESCGTAYFGDVCDKDWYYNYVNTAFSYGIVNGVSDGCFNPNGVITRQEAAIMISRASKLCGMNTDMDMSASRDVLAQFTDYINVSSWAFDSLAFCYDEGILEDDVLEIKPMEAVSRGEIAYMVYNMLRCANLL